MQESSEFPGVLALRERVVVVHRAIAAARLKDRVLDAGIGHLRDQELGRADDLLHPDGHVLHVVVLALVGEGELAIGPDPEIDVDEARPGIVALAEQHRRFHFLAIARAEGARRRPRHDLLQVFEVDGARAVAAGAVPVLEDVRVAVDDQAAPSFSIWCLKSLSISPFTVRNVASSRSWQYAFWKYRKSRGPTRRRTSGLSGRSASAISSG